MGRFLEWALSTQLRSAPEVHEVSLFMGVFILGGFIFQYPLGWLSDSIGRKKVIIFSCIAGAIASILAMYQNGDSITFYALAAAVGGCTMPMYALCGVHTNDYLTPTQMVAASGTLVLVSSTGATLGSPLTAFAMDFFGPRAFYLSLGGIMLAIASFALYRTILSTDTKGEERGDFVAMPTAPLTVALNPNVELDIIEATAETDIEEIENSFEELVEDLQALEKEDAP